MKRTYLRQRGTRGPILCALAVLLIFVGPVSPMMAQVSTVLTDEPPLVVGFVIFPPFYMHEPDGTRTGFSVDLIETLADEIGLSVEYKEFNTPTELLTALAAGEIDTLPGSADLPMLRDSTVLSSVAWVATQRLVARAEMAKPLSNAPLEGLKIGIIPPTTEANFEDLSKTNTFVDFASRNGALMGLLSGEVDGLIMSNSTAFGHLRAANLDHRIGFVDPPVRSVDRFVPLHNSRANLLSALNAGIAQIKADGRLDRLVNLYSINAHPPATDVLTVGVTHFPPYNIHNEDGTFSGFSVETMRDIARLANLDIVLQPITQEEFGIGPAADTYDMLTQAGVNADRLERMDFTTAIERFEFSIFTRAGDAEGLSDLDSLVGKTVGVQTDNLGERFAEDHGGFDIVKFGTVPALVDGLESGAVDAILFPRRGAHAEIKQQGIDDEIDEVSPPFRVVERAPALRFGLGAIRERLNAVIPGYLLSEDYQFLRQKYFAAPVFWTQARLYAALAAIGAAFLGLLGALFLQRQRQRQLVFVQQQKELSLEKTYSDELGKSINELERSNRDLDEFAYIASHDLKEPLRGIGINSNFLLREDLPDKARERAMRMSELAGRMEQLISDLLFFSRLGRGDMARVKVSAHQTIQAIRSDTLEWLQEHNAEIVELDQIPSLHVERVKFKTVMQNLITNAIKYNESVLKRVEIGFVREVIVEGETMRDAIFVKDNGIGISDVHHDKVFRIFSRLNEKQKYQSGSGSGLAFVRRIVEEHGGKINFTSKPGSGTIFYFTMPLAEQAEAK